MKKVEIMRGNSQFCDVTFVVDGHKFVAHKMIMAAVNDYFAAMFNSGFKEVDMEEIPIKGIPSQAFEKIIRYIYSGILTVDNASVVSMYEAADLLQYTVIQNDCIRFILKHISVETCIGYLLFAEKYSLTEVKSKSEGFIFSEFDKVVACKNFSEIPCQMLIDILSSQKLACQEAVVLNGICKWLTQHSAIVEEQRSELIQTLRYTLLDGNDVEVLNNHINILGENNVILIQKKLLMRFLAPNSQPLHDGLFNTPRGPTCLVVVGGTDAAGSPTDKMIIIPIDQKYDVKQLSLALPSPRSECAALNKGNFLFLIGGKDKKKIYNSVHRFDVMTKRWTEMAPMNVERHQHVAVVLNNIILVAGGKNGQGDILSSVEMYNIEEDKWQNMKDFPHKVCKAGACELKGKVYICGGLNAIETRSCTHIHEYNEKGDVWLLKGHLESDVYDHGMTSNNGAGICYIVGGKVRNKDGKDSIYGSIHKCEVKDDTIEEVNWTVMPYFISSVAAVSFENKLFCTGGDGRKAQPEVLPFTTHNIIQEFNTKNKLWSELDIKLPEPLQHSITSLLVFPHETFV